MTSIKRAVAAPLAVTTAIAAFGHIAMAAVPAQFTAWGTKAPPFPPVPAGWTRALGPAASTPAMKFTTEDRKRGYVLFARDPLTPVSTDAAPGRSERLQNLFTVAAQGEYVPISFAIHALRPLQQLRVTVSPLRSASGAVIPADHIDIRVVRPVRTPVDPAAHTYRLEPFLIEKIPSVSVPADANIQFWLTIKVPNAAPAGEYRGRATIEGIDGAAAPITLRVLPFSLPPVSTPRCLSFSPPADNAMLEKELIDLREHGLFPDGLVGTHLKSRDRHFGPDDVAATRQENDRVIKAALKVYGRLRFPLSYEVGNQVIEGWDPNIYWMVFWPHSRQVDADFLKAVQVGLDQAKAEGWPPLRIYALDEAGAHGLLDEAVYYYGLLAAHLSNVRSYTTIGGGIAMGHDEIGRLGKIVTFLDTNRFSPEIAHALVARGKPFGVYNGARSTPASARFFFGFYGWKTSASQVLQWAYHEGDSPFNGNGFRKADEGYVYEAPDGPLPSLMMEGARAGVDDYRFVELLRDWISRARQSTATGARAAADAAENRLDSLMEHIPMTYQAVNSEDRSPTPPDSLLRQWRWAIAQEIIRLQTYGGGRPVLAAGLKSARAAAAVGSGGPGRRSPFDLPWAAPAPQAVRYGPELLPAGEFGKSLDPWQAQVWNGKAGGGVLDPAVTHERQPSARLEIPAGGSSQNVVTLVWGNWGVQKLDLTLNGGRTYEFSAWVRQAQQGTLPTLRIALSGAAAPPPRSGVDEPDASGWRRVWTRVTPRYPVTPGYLAVWLQGPQTDWVSGLSLREVIPPIVTLSMARQTFDEIDRSGSVDITAAPGVTPGQIRITLAHAGGPAVATLLIPFETQPTVATAGDGLAVTCPAVAQTCTLNFDPSTLAPGKYEVRAELLDAAGGVMGAGTVDFERAPAWSWGQQDGGRRTKDEGQ